MAVPACGTDTLRAALQLAIRAPAVRNWQPWRWRVDNRRSADSSVDLYAEFRTRLPHSDPDARDLMISCGAALHHLVVALAALGWNAVVDRLPGSADPRHLAHVELHPQAAGALDIALAAAIPRRRTDRRHYGPWPVPRADIALMGARAARAGVTMRRLESLPELRRAVFPLGQDSGSDEQAVLVALGTVDDSRLARLRAGEATSVLLLTATAQGLASCPITEPLEIAETHRAVHVDVFGGAEFPQAILRVGYAAVNADPLPPPPRLSIDEVVEWHGKARRP